MSRVNRIQKEIKQLEGGAFQNLCDKYLYIKHEFKNILSLGSMEGTYKTTKGIPDSYVHNELNNKYTMIMYGTDKNSTNKLIKDIEDAIEKPGVPIEKIERIICCHTSSNISVETDQKLRELAAPVSLIIIGIDTMAQDLDSSFKYQKILKEFLGIEPTTDQIFILDDFIKKHDSSKTNAPISNPYIGDTNLIQILLDKLNDNDILLIKGNPGAGKTKLAVEICHKLVEHNVITVKSNGLSEYQDIKDVISENKINYIFIDDANKLMNFEAIVDLISLGTKNTKIKFIMTIRDYLFKTVENKLSEYKLEVHNLNTMANDDLNKLVESVNPQLNESDKKHIINLSNNNPRLVVLASNFKNTDLKNLKTVKDLMRIYYERVIDDHALDITEQKVINIIHFLGKLNYRKIEEKQELLEYFDLDKDEFIETTEELHEKEVCDIYLDEAVNLRDQSLGDYLAIKFFRISRKNKVVSLFKLLFPQYKKQIVELLNQVSHFDTTQEWTLYLKEELRSFYLTSNDDIKADLLKQYAPLLDEEALIYVKSKIVTFNTEELSITQKEFDNYRSSSINDTYIEILCSLTSTHKLKEASDLLAYYLTIKKSKVLKVYQAIKESFNIELSWNNYLVKREVILDSLSKFRGIKVINLLLINVIKEFIEFNGEIYEIKGTEIAIKRYQLNDDDYLIHFHVKLFNIVRDLYLNTNDEEVSLEIQLFLLNYPFHELKNGYENTVLNDIEMISNEIFNGHSLLLREQYIVYKFKMKLDCFGHNIGDLRNDSISKKVKLYHLVMKDVFTCEENNFNEAKYKKYLELYDFITIYYTDCTEILNDLSIFQNDELMQSEKLDSFLHLMFEYLESEQRNSLIKNLIVSNYNVEYNLIRKIVSRLNYKEVRDILIGCDIYNNEHWKIALFSVCDNIDKNTSDEFKEFVESINDKDILLNYHIYEFLGYVEEDPSILDLFIIKYFDSSIPYTFFIPEYITKKEARKTIDLISYDYSKVIYLENIDKAIDQSGEFLIELLEEKEDEFIRKILQKILSYEIDSNINYDYINPILWKINEIEDILSTIFKDMSEADTLSLLPFTNDLETFMLSDKDKSFSFIKKELGVADENYTIHLMNISISIYDHKDLEILFKILLEKHISFEAFKNIRIVKLSRSWTGSLVPLLDRDIEYIDNLLKIFNDIQFIEHTKRLLEIKDSLNEKKESELLSDFFDRA